MAWVATAELAAAVSNAGGLGIIGSGSMPGEILRQEIVRARQLTDRPFGVNIMLMSPFAADVMKVVCEERVAMVTTGAGNPAPFIDALKAANVKIVPVVAAVALAKRLERMGVDALVAEGMESGGHVGETTTMALVPQVVDAVGIPVIAAGGIGDGRGVAAAFCLGAEGVQIGTRFVCASECTAHQNYKQLIIRAKDRDTVVNGRITGHAVRSLANTFTREYEEKEMAGASTEELEQFGAGRLRAAVRDGDVANGSVMSGQIAGLVGKVQPAVEIMTELVNGAISALEGVNWLWEK
jgi:enoyl-[acyl-carrier protein] reductase II